MNAVELFAGAGGLALGVSRAGFQHLAMLESNPQACATIRENQRRGVSYAKDWPIEERDVRTYEYSHPRRSPIDLLSAGVPCQPFSSAGKWLGQFDERNMFPEVGRAVRALEPRAFLVENVKGLTHGNFRSYLDYVMLELSYPRLTRRAKESWEDHWTRLRDQSASSRGRGPDYQVSYHVLNAANYGVPQMRERIFIVGFRADLGVEWTPPPSTHSLDTLLWSQWHTREYWKEHGLRRAATSGPQNTRFAQRLIALAREKTLTSALPRWRTVRDAIAGLPRLRAGQRSTEVENHFLNPGARAYPRHTGAPIDEPAKTLKAGNHGVPGGENMLALRGAGVRYFSVRECARLQTFPDDYVFPETWTRGMRQVGNAVPVVLAQAMASGVVEVLNSIDASVRSCA